jgi:c-di-GMP phosphodiesterase
MSETKSDRDALSVSVARQPVFDDKGKLWGYEIFLVGSVESECPTALDRADAAITVESSAYMSIQQILQSEKKILVNFSEKSIQEKLPYALPPALTVIKVCEQSALQPVVVDLLMRMKADGYLIAVRGFTGNSECEALYRLAHIIVIDTGSRNGDMLARQLSAARKYPVRLLASQVQDRKLYEACKGMGFSLFHGAFFKSPEKLTVRKLSSNEALRLRILQFIESDSPDVNQLAETIQSDATISYRLLAYLNSAAFAFPQTIKSIHQAIALLGWSKVKNWLRVLALTDMSPSKDTQDLVRLSAQRGMFLELVARDHDFWGFDPESLQLLGIFSLLDALLNLPMTEIVANLPIDGKMKSALCREPNNEYLPLLNLAQCMEEARWTDAEKLIQQLNLDGKKVTIAFQNSINWANELDSLHSGKPKVIEK